MASNIHPFAISAPGFYGLNTQDSPIDLDSKFCLDATNVVIDKYGRVGARKGWIASHTSNTDLASSDIECIGEVVQNNGTITTVCAGGGFLFKHSGVTLTTLTYGGGGSAPVISADNWQFCQLGGVGVFWQRGYDPLIYDPAVSTTTYRRVSEKSGYAGTVQLSNCAISAYGRIFNADTLTDKNTLQWSDLLTTHVWTGGTSGTLDLTKIWPNGTDEIVALAAHNNQLIIFGKRQTLIYTGALTPSSMTLADTLDNVGCIARDSVQNTGEDIIFLSSAGVRSLARTIQEKSAPMRGVSKNIHNDLLGYIATETLADIKSVYSPDEAFYLLTLPYSNITFCFDQRFPLQDGSSRVTLWDGACSTALFYSRTQDLYLGKPGFLATYDDYQDNESSYRIRYYTPWADFGSPTQLSILKKILATVSGTSNQTFTFKWGFDYNSAQRSVQATISSPIGVSEYGIAEYGEDEYGGYETLVTIGAQASGYGKVLQIGVEADVDGSQISIQKIEIMTKDGRLGR